TGETRATETLSRSGAEQGRDCGAAWNQPPYDQPLDRRGRAGSRPGRAASLQGAPASAEEARSLQGDHPQAARGLSRALGGAAPGVKAGLELDGFTGLDFDTPAGVGGWSGWSHGVGSFPGLE